MAIQFLPIIKAVAPYVAQVAAYAIPAFTAKPEAVKADPVVVKQKNCKKQQHRTLNPSMCWLKICSRRSVALKRLLKKPKGRLKPIEISYFFH